MGTINTRLLVEDTKIIVSPKGKPYLNYNLTNAHRHKKNKISSHRK